MTVRDSIFNRLYADLVGPADAESAEQLSAYPTDVYLTGILFPQNSAIAEEESDQLQAEGVTDVDSNDVSKDEISLATVKRPSSAGLSFVVEAASGAPTISISVTAGRYEPVGADSDQEEDEVPEESDSEPQQLWQRIPVVKLLKDVTLDFPAKDIEAEGETGLGLHIRTSEWGSRMLVTVAMLNTNWNAPVLWPLVC